MKRSVRLKRGSGIARRVKLKPRSRQMVKDKELDALCRRLVVELRDGNACCRCFARDKVQWAHVASRRFKSIRWHPDNSLALCAGCHLWWHHRPIEAANWFTERYRERLYPDLRSPGKVDRVLTKLWLEQEIARYG